MSPTGTLWKPQFSKPTKARLFIHRPRRLGGISPTCPLHTYPRPTYVPAHILLLSSTSWTHLCHSYYLTRTLSPTEPAVLANTKGKSVNQQANSEAQLRPESSAYLNRRKRRRSRKQLGLLQGLEQPPEALKKRMLLPYAVLSHSVGWGQV